MNEERTRKRDAWREKAPDATRFDRTHTAGVATAFLNENDPRDTKTVMTTPTADVAMCGRILQKRDMGALTFMKIRDTSGDFQVCLAKKVLDTAYDEWNTLLDLGDIVGFSGEFFKTKHGEPSLMAVSVTPLTKALRPLPEKFHGLTNKETCYRQRYLDLATNPDTFRRFQIRSQVIREIRNFLEEKDFMEVETRILQPQAGGAMARVFDTHHNALDHEFVLRIALELDLKMLTVGGMERVYEIGKCFRNEGIDPSHLQEFTMLEWYAAYADLNDNMVWTQDMIQKILIKILGTTQVTVLDKNDEPVQIDFAGDWPKRRFPDLIMEFTGIDMASASIEEIREKALELGMPSDEAAKTGRGNLLDYLYKKTARPTLMQPTYVLDYPEELKPLARPRGDGTAECYQLLVAGWEIVNSYGELVDPTVQRRLLEEQAQAKDAGDDEAMDVDEVFLTAMEHGMPPQTGFGMGIDRFVALITGQPNLKDVVLFPLLRPEEAPMKKKPTLQLAACILNADVDLLPWQQMNTVAHLTAAFGARQGKDLLWKDTVRTADGEDIKLNVQHAIMMKQSNAKIDLISLKKMAIAQGLRVAEFTREMMETSNDKKVEAITLGKRSEEVERLGLLIFGDKLKVESITKECDLLS